MAPSINNIGELTMVFGFRSFWKSALILAQMLSQLLCIVSRTPNRHQKIAENFSCPGLRAECRTHCFLSVLWHPLTPALDLPSFNLASFSPSPHLRELCSSISVHVFFSSYQSAADDAISSFHCTLSRIHLSTSVADEMGVRWKVCWAGDGLSDRKLG